jgi:predicted DNA-binding protein with PD1-like motif
MQAKLINEQGEQTIALVFETNDEVVAGLTAFAKRRGLAGSHFTGIGAFSDVVLGYFDWERKEYDEIPVEEQVEVLSMVGDVALKGEDPQLHAHVVLGRRDGSTVGGHLLEAYVRPTLEIILTESPEHLRKRTDEETGLALIEL